MEQISFYVPIIIAVVVVLCLLLTARWILSLRRVVKPSEVHVVRCGKVTRIYGATSGLTREHENADDAFSGNVYYNWPSWLPIIGVDVSVLPLSIFDINLQSYEAYDKDRLPFIVDIKAFFRISDYKQAASRISDNRTLREHLQGIVQGAVRSILAQQILDNIMSERSTYGDKFTAEVKEQLKHWGVEAVKNIELMDIRDADGEEVISNIMKKKKSEIEKESRITVAKNRQEAQEAEINAEQEVSIKKQASMEAIGKREAEREKAVGITQESSRQAVQEQAKITKEKEMEVKKVEIIRQAEIEKERVIVNANAAKEQREIDAKAEVLVAAQKKDAQRTEAEARVLVAEQAKIAAEHDANAIYVRKTKEAAANLVAAQNEAQGIEAKGLAEATAKEKAGLADVQPQIALAREIGENQGYQTYLIEIKRVEASQAIGVEQAKNLGNAQIKIIANSGSSISEGVDNVRQLFSAKGGQVLGAALEALSGSEIGEKLLNKLLPQTEETDQGLTPVNDNKKDSKK